MIAMTLLTHTAKDFAEHVATLPGASQVSLQATGRKGFSLSEGVERKEWSKHGVMAWLLGQRLDARAECVSTCHMRSRKQRRAEAVPRLLR
jgi:hypothetical protein